MTVLDGQSLPIDGEADDQLDFRLLTDVGTIHAPRVSQVVDASIGPVSVVCELRELASEEAAITFVTDSQGRVQAHFGNPLTTFTITEFDTPGDQGAGFIYLLNQPEGGFVGGVTGYTRLGTYVSVVNVNVRGDGSPTPDQLALIQNGRYFADPGVEINRAQIERWIGLGAPRSIPVPD